MRRWIASGFLALASLAAAAPQARAQGGALVHGTVSAAVADGTTSPSFGGGVTWRFNDVLGIGVELSHLRSLTSTFAHIYCCTDNGDRTRATTFTTNVRVEIPTASERVIPFVIGGGGVAAVSESYQVWYADLAAMDLVPDLRALGLTRILPGPSDVTTTTTNMALTLGGGASFLITEHVALDADLRVLHIIGDQSRNIGRFGVGASIRF